MSVLHAISEGRLHQTRLLLDIGSNPDCRDKDGKTPLMLSCFVRKEHIGVRIARMILDKGADVTAIDKNGCSALSYACMTGRGKIVSMLLNDLDYDINLPDKEGNTPLIYAAMSGNPAVLKQILTFVVKFGLDVDFRNKKGFSAYLMAAKLGHFNCARILKLEGYASDCIRDTEFFLSDKEWAKKTRKELLKLQRESAVPHSARYRPNSRMSMISRPQTCPPKVEFMRSDSPVRPQSRIAETPRACSRLTIRSEPRTFQVNNWLPTREPAAEKASRVTSASTDNSLLVSNSSRSSTTIPSVARSQTPDLHAIFDQYFHGYGSYPPVKLVSFKLIEAQQREEAAVAAAAAEDALSNLVNMKNSPLSMRKMSRMQAPGRLRKQSVAIK